MLEDDHNATGGVVSIVKLLNMAYFRQGDDRVFAIPN
jgi:hypothetical protein